MKLNKDITIQHLENFKLNTHLKFEDIRDKIYEVLVDSIEFREFCKKDNLDEELICDIEIDILEEPLLCVYSKYSSRLSLYIREDKIWIRAWYDNAKDVIIDEKYRTNRKVPKFIRSVISALLVFNIILSKEVK